MPCKMSTECIYKDISDANSELNMNMVFATISWITTKTSLVLIMLFFINNIQETIVFTGCSPV